MEAAAEPEAKEAQNTAENAPPVSDEPQLSSRDAQRPSDETGTSQSQNASKPNKVYIGGLPDDTREADLRDCFGTFGAIKSIELKTGYGFVEFDSRAAAEKAVTVYHDGSFLGNTIRVELSHGGSKPGFKTLAEPGACFKCGQHGHWARECPNHVVAIQRKGWVDRTGSHGSLHSRGGSFRDGHSASLPPPRTPRDDYRTGGRRQDDYGSNSRDHAIREPRRPGSPYYEYNRQAQPVPHGYDDRRYPTGPARAAYHPDRPLSPYGVPLRAGSQIGPRDYGRGYERLSAPYEPRPLPHNADSYTDNGTFTRRPDPYGVPSPDIHGGPHYVGYPPAERDAPARRSPPRVGGRYQEYGVQGSYDRPYERRRSASPPPPYRAVGPHPPAIHPTGNGYTRLNSGSYGRPQSYPTGSGYGDRGPSGPRGQAPHMGPMTGSNSTNRIGERDYRPYRG